MNWFKAYDGISPLCQGATRMNFFLQITLPLDEEPCGFCVGLQNFSDDPRVVLKLHCNIATPPPRNKSCGVVCAACTAYGPQLPVCNKLAFKRTPVHHLLLICASVHWLLCITEEDIVAFGRHILQNWLLNFALLTPSICISKTWLLFFMSHVLGTLSDRTVGSRAPTNNT